MLKRETRPYLPAYEPSRPLVVAGIRRGEYIEAVSSNEFRPTIIYAEGLICYEILNHPKCLYFIQQAIPPLEFI
jgi:hypothetical protein